MMKHYLVKFNDCYADEFDVEGFMLMNEKDLKRFYKRVERTEYPIEFYFGTNEFIEYISKEHYLENVTVQEISESVYSTLKELFPNEIYGTFLTGE